MVVLARVLLEENSDVLIIECATGAGKSVTTAPMLLRIYDYKKRILLSQPRTVTVESTASIISQQLDLNVGDYIGYQYSGGHVEAKNTFVHIVTDFFLTKLFNSSAEENAIPGYIFSMLIVGALSPNF